jgi:TolA-binding protein
VGNGDDVATAGGGLKDVQHPANARPDKFGLRQTAQYLERIETYEAGFRKSRERDFTQAKIRFSQFLEFYPKDALSKMYLERAREYEAQLADQAWNEVEVLKKK